MMQMIGRSRFTFVFAALIFSSWQSHAESPEYQLKAAFLYNFAKFIEWPADAFSSESSPINICITGQESFGSTLDAVTRKTAQNRQIAVKRLPKDGDTKGCHITYFGELEVKKFHELLTASVDRPMLTIGDGSNFLDAGGIIELVSSDNRVQFEVNLDGLKRANIQLNPQLMKLAKSVRGGKASK